MSRHKKTKLQRRVEYALASSVAGFFRLLPHRNALRVGGGIGLFLHDIIGIRKQVARDNVAHAFPEKDHAWVNRTVRGAYKTMGMTLAATSRIPALKGEAMERWVKVDGEEYLHEVFAKGKGALVATIHFGLWELNGAWSANRGMETTYVVAEQANPLIEDLIDEHRAAVGVHIVKRQNAMRGIVKALRDNHLIAMMIDQSGGAGGEFIPWFSRPASTFRGIAVFALKTKSPVLMLTGRHIDGVQHVTIRPVPLTYTGDKKQDTKTLLYELHQRAEAAIREAPEQYLWLHKRWKYDPPDGWEWEEPGS